MPRHLYRHLLWAALFGVLLHALSGTISYLKASIDGIQVVEVCTSFGIERIHLDAAGNPIDAPPAEHAVHCDYCAAGQTPGLHRTTVLLEQAGSASEFIPAWFPQVRLHPETRPIAHAPRAPPVLS